MAEQQQTRLVGLVDRLKAHSEWKYPNRLWNKEFYDQMLFVWRGKEDLLQKRVELLEKQMSAAIAAQPLPPSLPFMVISHSDVATIEALHDLLIDKHGYSLDHITLKRARLLTAKMYAALKPTTIPEV